MAADEGGVDSQRTLAIQPTLARLGDEPQLLRLGRWPVGEGSRLQHGIDLVPPPVLPPVEREHLAARLDEDVGGLQAGQDTDVMLGRRASEHDRRAGHRSPHG